MAAAAEKLTRSDLNYPVGTIRAMTTNYTDVFVYELNKEKEACRTMAGNWRFQSRVQNSIRANTYIKIAARTLEKMGEELPHLKKATKAPTKVAGATKKPAPVPKTAGVQKYEDGQLVIYQDAEGNDRALKYVAKGNKFIYVGNDELDPSKLTTFSNSEALQKKLRAFKLNDSRLVG